MKVELSPSSKAPPGCIHIGSAGASAGGLANAWFGKPPEGAQESMRPPEQDGLLRPYSP
jgi:hypothetical protein